MAVSIFEPEFLDSVEENDISLYGDTLGRAMEQDKKFCIYSHDRWRHIQTLTDWYEAQQDYFRT
jgi:NDP-sugar pyrophosphorylase family protein